MTDILDEPFSPCALQAFITEAKKINDWPKSEDVRKEAYRLYEEQKRG